MPGWHSMGPFTVFDIETTGTSPVRDRIVELAALRIGEDGLQQRFHSLVNPEMPIHPAAQRIHGIDDSMVAKAPKFKELAQPFMDFAKGSKLVAHNARFDLSFLQESLARESLPLWDGGAYDSITLARKAYPGLPSYSLQSLRSQFALGDGSGVAHRAQSDVEWTVEIFSMSMKLLYEASL